jgi:hypothetical protein
MSLPVPGATIAERDLSVAGARVHAEVRHPVAAGDGQ